MNVDKAQKNILIIVFITTMLVMLIAFIIFAMIDENNDWPNALTLMVEVAVGIIIALIIYIHSKDQHDANQKLVSRMNSTLKELERSLLAERRLVSHALVLRLNGVVRSLDYVLKHSSKHDKTHGQEREEILIQQQQKTKDLVSQSDLGIRYHELARIFDEVMAARYRDLQTRLLEIPTSFSDIESYNNNRDDNIKYWKSCINDCNIIINNVKRYVKDHNTASNTD